MQKLKETKNAYCHCTFANEATTLDLKKFVVRYNFREANKFGLDSIRRWKLQHAKICTYTSVNEDSE